MTFPIVCPNCGPREGLEFVYGGETTRRAGPGATDDELASYLVFGPDRRRLARRRYRRAVRAVRLNAACLVWVPE